VDEIHPVRMTTAGISVGEDDRTSRRRIGEDSMARRVHQPEGTRR
jgi:hypothetical protein